MFSRSQQIASAQDSHHRTNEAANHGRGFFSIVPTVGMRGRSVNMSWSMAYLRTWRIKTLRSLAR
jgi:hypothetical protein